jgi:two-component system, NarL family, response regulator DesR
MAAALQHHADVAVLDIDLPGVDGLTAAAGPREQPPACRVLILTGLARPGNLGRALAAGVSGFLVKDGPADDLVDAVRRVARGERVFAAQPRGLARSRHAVEW